MQQWQVVVVVVAVLVVGKAAGESGAVAAVAGGYYGVKFYKSRQEGLIRDFAYSMMMY